MSLNKIVMDGWLKYPETVIPPQRTHPLWETLPEPNPALLKEDVLDLLLHSVESTLPRNHHYSLWFSGGIDSTILAWCMKKLDYRFTAITIDFGSYPDEVDRSRIAAKALNLRHTIFRMSLKNHLSLLKETIQRTRQPTDFSTQTLYISKLSKRINCDASVEALGLDELFAGYPELVDVSYSEILFNAREAEALERARSNYAYIDASSSILPIYFPFLEHSLISYARALPTQYKTDGINTKLLLRDRFRELIPEENRTAGTKSGTKRGFTPVINEWWAQGLGNWVYWQLLKLPFKMKLSTIRQISRYTNWRLLRLATVPTFLELFRSDVK